MEIQWEVVLVLVSWFVTEFLVIDVPAKYGVRCIYLPLLMNLMSVDNLLQTDLFSVFSSRAKI